MRYRLNPQLVRQNVYRDPTFPYREQAIFLRDPYVVPNGYEPGIGEVILNDVQEDFELAAQWAEDGRVFDDDGETPPRIFRTHGCFGFSPQDEVLLIINSGTEPIKPEGEAR